MLPPAFNACQKRSFCLDTVFFTAEGEIRNFFDLLTFSAPLRLRTPKEIMRWMKNFWSSGEMS